MDLRERARPLELLRRGRRPDRASHEVHQRFALPGLARRPVQLEREVDLLVLRDRDREAGDLADLAPDRKPRQERADVARPRAQPDLVPDALGHLARHALRGLDPAAGREPASHDEGSTHPEEGVERLGDQVDPLLDGAGPGQGVREAAGEIETAGTRPRAAQRVVAEQQLLDPPKDVARIRGAASELSDLGVELLRLIEGPVDVQHDRPGGQTAQIPVLVGAIHDDDVGIEALLEEAGGLPLVGHRRDVVARQIELAVQIAPEIVLRLHQKDPSRTHHRPILPSTGHRHADGPV